MHPLHFHHHGPPLSGTSAHWPAFGPLLLRRSQVASSRRRGPELRLRRKAGYEVSSVSAAFTPPGTKPAHAVHTSMGQRRSPAGEAISRRSRLTGLPPQPYSVARRAVIQRTKVADRSDG